MLTELKRPKWNDQMHEELSQFVGKIIHDWEGDKTLDLEDCVEAARKRMRYSWNDNGYDLAKLFERELHIKPDGILVSDLDEVSYETTAILKKHIKEWVKAENIKPSLEVGDRVIAKFGNKEGEGEIVKIYEDEARYGICFECFGHVKGQSNGVVDYENVINKI